MLEKLAINAKMKRGGKHHQRYCMAKEPLIIEVIWLLGLVGFWLCSGGGFCNDLGLARMGLIIVLKINNQKYVLV